MEKQIDLSIVVPVYQTAKYLPQCLDSLLKQKGLYAYEVILVDDGSTDGGQDVCDSYAEKYPSFFRVVHQKNQGLGPARNTGIEAAKGEFISFVDSDDICFPDYVLTLLRTVKNKAEVLCGCAGFSYLSEKEKEVAAKIKAYSGTVTSIKAVYLLLGDYKVRSFVWDKVFSRKLLLENDIRFYSFKAGFEDLPFVCACFLNSPKVCFQSKPCYYYRNKREGSLTQGGLGEKRLKEHLASFFACRAMIEEKYGADIAVKIFKKREDNIILTLSADIVAVVERKRHIPKAFIDTIKFLRVLGSKNIPLVGSFYERQVRQYVKNLHFPEEKVGVLLREKEKDDA